MMSFMRTIMLFVLYELLMLEMAHAYLTNVALGKPTKQIDSLHSGAVSSLANDGNLSQDFGKHLCTHTRASTNTWWMVDLLYVYDVNAVQILNRDTDARRLTGIDIYVSMVNPLPMPGPDGNLTGQKCLSHAGMVPNDGLRRLNCTRSFRGRYVYVWKPFNHVLTLCEFQVLVADNARKTSCTIIPGHKSLLPPVYSTYLTQSPTINQCVATCQSYPERESTHIQFNTVSGMCECVQHSSLYHNTPGIGSDPDFDVCRIDEMVSFE